MRRLNVAGIDLTGKEEKPSSTAILTSRKVIIERPKTNQEITHVIDKYKPRVISIDAPLTLPSKGLLRDLERKALKKGLRLLPPLMRGMKELTLRGVKIAKILREKGYDVIETHPSSARKVMNWPKKIDEIRSKIRELGIEICSKKVSRDDIDAITAAIVGALYLIGEYERITGEGVLILPKGEIKRNIREKLFKLFL